MTQLSLCAWQVSTQTADNPVRASHQEIRDVQGLLCSLARVWHSPHSKVTMLPFVLDSHLAGRGFEIMQNLSISPHFQPWTLPSKCNFCLQWLTSPKWWADSHSTGDENANDPGGSTWKVLLFWKRSVWKTWCGCSGGSYLACARLWVPLPAMPKLNV